MKHGGSDGRAGQIGNIWIKAVMHPPAIWKGHSTSSTTCQQNLGEGQYDIPLKGKRKPRHVSDLHNAMHKSEPVFMYSVYMCVYWRQGRWVFSEKLAPSRLQVPTTLCPTKPIPNLCLTSCQDHMTPPKKKKPHQHHQQLRRDPPTTTTELFRVPSGRLWPMVGHGNRVVKIKKMSALWCRTSWWEESGPQVSTIL